MCNTIGAISKKIKQAKWAKAAKVQLRYNLTYVKTNMQVKIMTTY